MENMNIKLKIVQSKYSKGCRPEKNNFSETDIKNLNKIKLCTNWSNN